MSIFRRIMLSGGLNSDIDSLPETQKIYYTATAKVTPKSGTIGTVLVNNYDSKTGQGIICFNFDVIKIGDSAFENARALNSIIIPNSVTTIEYRAFYYCNSLASVTIPDSVMEIGGFAFDGCKKLTSVTIPNSVTSIGYSAFMGCSSLTSINIGNSVTSIGEGAFWNCKKLTSIYCEAITPPSLGYSVFKYEDYEGINTNIGCPIYVPIESVDAYKSATRWSEYADAIVGYDFENNVPVE